MFNINNYFTKGLRNTLLQKPGINMSVKGPWVQVYNGEPIDRWYVGDFVSAEYTISVDLDQTNREIIKCLLVAGPEDASVVVYGRIATANQLVTVDAQVNGSYAELILAPKDSAANGCKVSFSATYYEAHNPI